MQATYEVMPVRGRSSVEAFARDVRDGLSASPKQVPARYFYDETGGRLFQQITEQPEYYLTRCELEILKRHQHDLAGLLAREPFQLVELGAGDGRKTEVLLRCFLQHGLKFHYVPVDICQASLVELAVSLHKRDGLAGLCVHGIVAEYFDALELLGRRGPQRSLVLLLGSSGFRIQNHLFDGQKYFADSLWEAR